MSKLKPSVEFQNLKTLEELKKYLSIFSDDLHAVINGNIELNENTKTQLVNFNFQTANLDLSVAHKLGRIPVGYILVSTNAYCRIKSGVARSTTTSMTLQSDAVANTSVMIF